MKRLIVFLFFIFCTTLTFSQSSKTKAIPVTQNKIVTVKPKTDSVTATTIQTALVGWGEHTPYGRKLFYPKTGTIIYGINTSSDRYDFDTIIVQNGLNVFSGEQRLKVIKDNNIGIVAYLNEHSTQDSFIRVIGAHELSFGNLFFEIADLESLTIIELKDLLEKLYEKEEELDQQNKEANKQKSESEYQIRSAESALHTIVKENGLLDYENKVMKRSIFAKARLWYNLKYKF